jgi:hypothetical protein
VGHIVASVADPGCLSRIWPFLSSWILHNKEIWDKGSEICDPEKIHPWGKKAPDPGSRSATLVVARIRNTGCSSESRSKKNVLSLLLGPYIEMHLKTKLSTFSTSDKMLLLASIQDLTTE